MGLTDANASVTLERFMKLFICTLLLFSSIGSAETVSTAAPSPVKSNARTKLKKSYYQTYFEYTLWQEKIDANAGSTSGSIPFQFTGVKIGTSYNTPYEKIRWVRSYAGDLSFGTTKGGSTTSALTDEFKNQLWLALTFTPGITYRSSATSEISLIAPFVYRKVSWTYDDTSAIQVDRSSSFSVGLGLLFALRFTPKSSIYASMTHQQLWNTTHWSFGWQYAFK